MRYLIILLLLSTNTFATTYYVSNSGSDAANGTSTGTAWQTSAKVNGFTFSAGDIIQFNGGQSFAALTIPRSNLTMQSYGTGLATISSGTSNGIYALNKSDLVIQNLIVTGSGISSNTAYGVIVENSQAGNTKLNNITLANLNVSGYGNSGIFITSSAGTSGFNNVLLSYCIAHDNTGGVISGLGSAGIMIQSPNFGYGLGSTLPCFTNVTVDHCTAYNNTGKSGDTNWTGSGIFMGETSAGIIQYCTAYNNGANSTSTAGGPVGIWFADVINCTIQFCESYANTSGNGSDGSGIDADGGCVSSILQYNYTHDNKGPGYMVYTYNDGIITGSNNIIVRYNLSKNDGPSASVYYGNIMIGNDGGTLTNIYVYNNTFYQDGVKAGAVNIGFEGAQAASITGIIANNILYSSSGVKFVHSSALPVMTIVGNNYYTSGTPSYVWNSTNYSTFSAWQSASGKELISAVNVGKQSNPQFMSINGPATGLRQNSTSTVLGQGLNLNTIYGLTVGSRDYFGNNIPNASGNYDIGAHQYRTIIAVGRITLN